MVRDECDVLSQIHIDAARNSTDDFNPFHDPYKWGKIASNPFNGPIALGFQLGALAAHQVDSYRHASGEVACLNEHALQFSNYQLSFADVARSGDRVRVEIRPTKNSLATTGQISNRLSIRSGGRLLILGHQRETRTPVYLADRGFSDLHDLTHHPDRSFLAEGRYFLKRKYMNNSNAKNFLAGSLVDQHYYFDELEDRVRYPAMFPVALLSCALLEKAHLEGYDFFNRPMVYTNHNISVDRSLLADLRSNDRLHLLVEGPEPVDGEGGLGRSDIPKVAYNCFGLVAGNNVLFRARVLMALLEHVVAAVSNKTARKRV